MTEQSYRSGPGLFDLAVRLPNGKWMRLANNLTLTDAQVEEWVPLVPGSELGEAYGRGIADGTNCTPNVARIDRGEVDKLTDLAAGYVEGDVKGLTFSQLAEAIERGAYQRGESNAYQRGFDVGASVPRPLVQKVPPSEQKIRLLVVFEKHTEGLTMREAAEAAGLIGVPNYSSRYGSDLLKEGWVQSLDGGNRNGSKVLGLTELGAKELARVRGLS